MKLIIAAALLVIAGSQLAAAADVPATSHVGCGTLAEMHDELTKQPKAQKILERTASQGGHTMRLEHWQLEQGDFAVLSMLDSDAACAKLVGNRRDQTAWKAADDGAADGLRRMLIAKALSDAIDGLEALKKKQTP